MIVSRKTLSIIVIASLLLGAWASTALAHTRTVPKGLTNRPLNVVENRLDALGIGFKTVGGGIFGIIVKSDWGVCAVEPGAGNPIHGPIKLVVGHFTCGA